MELPESVFESIVGCGSVQLENSRGIERRRKDRLRHPARIHVIPMTQSQAGHPISCQIRDLSPTGIGLLLPHEMKIGDCLLVRLVVKKMYLWIFCDVTRVERVAKGLYVTGASYNRLVAPLAAPAQPQLATA